VVTPQMDMATLAVDSQCLLGESVLWCEQRERLYWVDIEGAKLWQHDPASSLTQMWTLPDRPACLALGIDGRLLIGLAKGLYFADLNAAGNDAALAPTLIAQVEAGTGPDTRLNDGRADRHGNFVFGTKNERGDRARIGRFYQYSVGHGLRTLDLPQAAIPNSICFDASGNTMYFCDSIDPRILRCRYDSRSASVSSIETFVELDHPEASPDGSIVDAEDHLWNAQWGAGRVVRYAPDGSVSRCVSVPVSQPSCCALGGSGGSQLFVTSASIDMKPSDLEDMPAAGDLFVANLRESLARPADRVLLP